MFEVAWSVVLPAFNEAGRIAPNLRILREAFPGAEIVVSDDGSTDATAAEAEAAGARVLRNPHKGRGAALKAGLAAASGDLVVTVDADLSYGPEEVRRLFGHLEANPACDLVIGSCYMPGGRTQGVPLSRLLPSRWGNALLSFAFHGQLKTTTGILRGYRRGRLQAILPTLVSDGKELYLEFLHKALAAGWRVDEVPASLRWNRRGERGKSGWSMVLTLESHLGFVLARSPVFLWSGWAAILLFVVGAILDIMCFGYWRFSVETPHTWGDHAILFKDRFLAGSGILAGVGVILEVLVGAARSDWGRRLKPGA